MVINQEGLTGSPVQSLNQRKRSSVAIETRTEGSQNIVEPRKASVSLSEPECGLPLAPSPQPSLDGDFTMSTLFQDMFPLYDSSSMDEDLKCTDNLGISPDDRSVNSAPWPLNTTWINDDCPAGKNNGKPFNGPVRLRVWTRANSLQTRKHSLGL